MKKSKFTQAQIMKILAEKGEGKSITEICKNHGISEPTFYNWQTKYLGNKKIDRRSAQFTPSRSHETPDRIRQLENELSQFKRLYAEVSLENHLLKNKRG